MSFNLYINRHYRNTIKYFIITFNRTLISRRLVSMFSLPSFSSSNTGEQLRFFRAVGKAQLWKSFISFRAARAKRVCKRPKHMPATSRQRLKNQRPNSSGSGQLLLREDGFFRGSVVGYQFLPRASSCCRIKILLQRGKSTNAFQGLGCYLRGSWMTDTKFASASGNLTELWRLNLNCAFGFSCRS